MNRNPSPGPDAIEPNTLARRLERVYQTVSRIPPGTVVTYGQLGDLAGLPRSARFVGYALRRTPPGINIPWHRVINAKGMISFPRDSAPYEEQRARLESEGVLFVNARIDLERYGWRHALDAILWGPDDWA